MTREASVCARGSAARFWRRSLRARCRSVGAVDAAMTRACVHMDGGTVTGNMALRRARLLTAAARAALQRRAAPPHR